MVTILFKEDISKQKEFIEKSILEGGIIIYPTDTIYGIGGRADSESVVKRIYELKQKDRNLPLNVIVPDFNFISTYFEVSDEEQKLLHSKLPGPNTILLTSKDSCPISKSLYKKEEKKGIRICDHYIQDIVFSLKVPLISASCNISNQKPPAIFEDIPDSLLKQVDLVIIDDSEVRGKGSEIFEVELMSKLVRKIR